MPARNSQAKNQSQLKTTEEYYQELTQAIKEAPAIYYRRSNGHYYSFTVLFQNSLVEIARFNTNSFYLTLKVLIEPGTLRIIYDLLEKLGYKYEFLNNEDEEIAEE